MENNGTKYNEIKYKWTTYKLKNIFRLYERTRFKYILFTRYKISILKYKITDML